MISKRYWFRGGVAGFIIGTLIVYFLPLACPYVGYDVHGSEAGSFVCNVVFSVVEIPILFVSYFVFILSIRSPINITEPFFPVIIGIIFVLLFTFFGSILGIMYGKIKDQEISN